MHRSVRLLGERCPLLITLLVQIPESHSGQIYTLNEFEPLIHALEELQRFLSLDAVGLNGRNALRMRLRPDGSPDWTHGRFVKITDRLEL
jgi:hypothetical protein